MHEAKTSLSRVVDRVADGAEIVIAQAGKPVAKLGFAELQVSASHASRVATLPTHHCDPI